VGRGRLRPVVSDELVTRSESIMRRSIGSPALFVIVYSSAAAAIYFSLGVVAGHALGLTPLVLLLAGVLFIPTAMTYVEGASLHPERGGSTVFARYAFNELVSFIAGWALLLDYVILIAVTSYTATQYLRVFWDPLGGKGAALGLSIALIAFVVLVNVRGMPTRRGLRIGAFALLALLLQLVIVAVGLALFFNPASMWHSIHLGSAPTWGSLVFALTITTVAFTGMESASGIAGEVQVGRKRLSRLLLSGAALIVIAYLGIGLVSVSALPVHDGHTALGHRYVDAPMLGIAAQMHPFWLRQTFRYLVGAIATLTLVAAANSAMLGLSRLAYTLSTNRQIPSGLGRLHPQRATPYVLIVIAGVIAAALVVPENLEFLIGLYAFGATLAFTIAHASIVKLRYSEPERRRPFKMPLSVRFRGGELPLPAAVAAVIFAAGWIAVLIVHAHARYAGLGWMVIGLLLYVGYRRSQETPLLRRVKVVPQMLSSEQPRERDYSSILVPLFGTALDDDIVQTAALLASGEPAEESELEGPTIEALWIFEIPLALPLDARLPDAQIKRARQALARAKAVGEEYSGVQVATAIVRTRRAGQAIVEEAKRRGVEAIVLGADEPSQIRGGGRLGGRASVLENFVGPATRYVVGKASCRVILTAPPASGEPADGRAAEPGERRPGELGGRRPGELGEGRPGEPEEGRSGELGEGRSGEPEEGRSGESRGGPAEERGDGHLAMG
jgi:APA family basic amino acid/polyamine antiporter